MPSEGGFSGGGKEHYQNFVSTEGGMSIRGVGYPVYSLKKGANFSNKSPTFCFCVGHVGVIRCLWSLGSLGSFVGWLGLLR